MTRDRIATAVEQWYRQNKKKPARFVRELVVDFTIEQVNAALEEAAQQLMQPTPLMSPEENLRFMRDIVRALKVK